MVFISRDKLSPSLPCDQPSVRSEMKPLSVHIEDVTVCFLVRAVVQVAHVNGRAAVDEY
jgi:hypothetical protein